MRDYFEMLGLPRRFAVDAAELERRYLERSREVHPDRAGAGGDGGAAFDLNAAYRALKRALPRAEHLFQLEGGRIGDNEPVDPELLGEMLELREELAEARAGGDRAAVARLEQAARQRERAELARLDGLFGDGDLAAVKEQIIRLRYLARYLEAFDEDEEG